MGRPSRISATSPRGVRRSAVTVSQGSRGSYRSVRVQMQEDFLRNEQLMRVFVSSLSTERFATYLRLAGGNELAAIQLYSWNSALSQSLWASVQAWEICLRNKLNDFLCWRYNSTWPYDEVRAIRQLTSKDEDRLRKARARQEQARRTKRAPAGAIVADLPAGFWVSLLTTAYENPFVWRSNLPRIFPHGPNLDRRAAWSACDRILNLRNRMAHHEPILTLPLEQLHADLGRTVAAMCPGTAVYVRGICGFRPVWSRRPHV